MLIHLAPQVGPSFPSDCPPSSAACIVCSTAIRGWCGARRRRSGQQARCRRHPSKRALSSAASLVLSVRRRLLLLGTAPVDAGQQLLLPLCDEDPLDDGLSDDVIGASGLSDVHFERTSLEEIARVAELASRTESKLLLLRRLLSRTSEPMIIFTEYRDTLAQLASMVSGASPTRPCCRYTADDVRRKIVRTRSTIGGVLLQPMALRGDRHER